MGSIEGGCFCGSIRYRISAERLATAACHCRKCQYGSGGGPNYVALAPKNAMMIVRGQPVTHRSVADSGAEVARVFCGACGTPLYSDTPNVPFLAVRVGSLDDSSQMAPQMHVWTEAAPAWHAFQPGAPMFAQGVAAKPS